MPNYYDTFDQIVAEKIARERPDVCNLMDYLRTTTFFTDPASARKHYAFDCGLVAHSINVYNALVDLYYNTPHSSNFDISSIAIVSLFHDVCKAGTYQKTYRNRKKYLTDEEASNVSKKELRKDNGGLFCWVVEEGFENNDTFPYGHGEKSVYIISGHMDLTDLEAQAIRFHMASWVESDKFYCSPAFEQNELALYLHWADEYATYILEKE